MLRLNDKVFKFLYEVKAMKKALQTLTLATLLGLSQQTNANYIQPKNSLSLDDINPLEEINRNYNRFNREPIRLVIKMRNAMGFPLTIRTFDYDRDRETVEEALVETELPNGTYRIRHYISRNMPEGRIEIVDIPENVDYQKSISSEEVQEALDYRYKIALEQKLEQELQIRE